MIQRSSICPEKIKSFDFVIIHARTFVNDTLDCYINVQLFA